MTKLNPFETYIEFPPNYTIPFSQDVELRIEASYHISKDRSPDDDDEIRLDKVIRISDDKDITKDLTDDQIDEIKLEALERIEQAESERVERQAGTHDDDTYDSGDGVAEQSDAVD